MRLRNVGFLVCGVMCCAAALYVVAVLPGRTVTTKETITLRQLGNIASEVDAIFYSRPLMQTSILTASDEGVALNRNLVDVLRANRTPESRVGELIIVDGLLSDAWGSPIAVARTNSIPFDKLPSDLQNGPGRTRQIVFWSFGPNMTNDFGNRDDIWSNR